MGKLLLNSMQNSRVVKPPFKKVSDMIMPNFEGKSLSTHAAKTYPRKKNMKTVQTCQASDPIEWFLREMHLFHTKQIFYGFVCRVTPPHCLHHVGPVEYMTRVK